MMASAMLVGCTMKLPKIITIKDTTWTVAQRWAPRVEGKLVNGYACPRTKTMVIDRSLSEEEKLETFLHECFHAFCFEMGTHHTAMSEDLEEILAESWANWLSKTFALRKKK